MHLLSGNLVDHNIYSLPLNFLIAAEAVDWTFAQTELLAKQGIDLRTEMDKR